MLGGDFGAVLSPPRERALGRSAVALWRLMLAQRGHEDRRFGFSVVNASHRLGVPLRTCHRALARLAAAGLVERTRTRVRRGDEWRSNLDVRVLGAACRDRAGEVLWVPGSTAEWCDRAPRWGGPRRVAGTLTGGQDGNYDDQGGTSAAPENGHLGHQVGAPENPTLESVPLVAPTGATKGSGPSSRPAALFVIDQRSVPRSRLTHEKLPKGDPGDPDDPQGPTTAEQRKLRYLWVAHLVSAYNAAFRAVNGTSAFLTLPGHRKADPVFSTWDPVKGVTPSPTAGPAAGPDDHLVKWKHYPKLLACAVELAARDIPPQTWAEWVLRRAAGKRLHVTAVFSRGQVASGGVRHAFRRESGYGHGAGGVGYHPTQVHLEQMYRMRERDRRKRGRSDLFGLPPWYSKMRQDELAQGVDDPMERFPRVVVRPEPPEAP